MSKGYDPVREHSSGEVKMLSLAQVMSQYEPGFPTLTWEQWLEQARNDSRVRSLMAELFSSGEDFFQVPIILGYYPEEIDEDGDVDPESYLIFDGMHRMAAYHFLGRERGIFAMGAIPRSSNHEFPLEISMTYEGKPSDDDFDVMYDVASWRVSGDRSKPWISIESAFTAPDEMSMGFHSYSDPKEVLAVLPSIWEDCWARFAFLKPLTVGVKLLEYIPDESDEAEERILGEIPLSPRRH